MTRTLAIKRSAGRLIQILGNDIWYGALLAAAAALLVQTISWLRSGHLSSLSVLDAILWSAQQRTATAAALDLISWVYRPSVWLGLHFLVSMTPLVVALVVLGVIGKLIGNRGRAVRMAAELAIFDERNGFKVSNPWIGDANRDVPDTTFASGPTRNLSNGEDTLTEPERDILRWLAVNGADGAVTTPEVMARNLGLSALAIDVALVELTRGGYATHASGRAELLERGVMYCVNRGWTMAVGTADGHRRG